MKLGTSIYLVDANRIQILHICDNFSSCFLGMISLSGEPLYCDKVQAGEMLHSAEFLLE